MDSSPVPTKGPPTGKTGTAQIAFMWFCTTVDILVVYEVLIRGESLLANRADVGHEMPGCVD